jgi:hypothetical protein
LPREREDRLFLHLVWPAAESATKIGASVDPTAAIATRIAHDFNSLLAPVLGNVILLEEEAPAATTCSSACGAFAKRPRRRAALRSG